MGVIFWGNRKLFSRSERGVRLALKHPLLVNRPVIGRGAYSIVLDDDESVFKLTIDRAAYELAERQSRWQCAGLPAIQGLHGMVGSIDCGVPLFLIEMERLQKLETGTATRSRCLSIARQLRRYLKDGETPYRRLRDVGTRQPDDGIGRALVLLAEILDSRWPAAELDLHGANFMQRPCSGEAVIADPFMDIQTRNIVFEKLLRKLDLP